MALVYNLINNGTEYEIGAGSCAAGNVVIPDTYLNLPVTRLALQAFNNCTSLTSVTIGNNVTSIGRSAFGYCTSLTSVTIPNSVTSIDVFAFYNCTSLISIIIPNKVTNIRPRVFSGCANLTSITIPNSVTIIFSSSFEFCTSLTSITIPKSVTSIGEAAFLGCTSLTKIYFLGNSPSFGSSCFNFTNVDLKLYRKKNFVTGWPSSVYGKPVVLWSDNVIKSGGTGKLIGLPKTYYISDSYQFTVNGSNFNLTGPIRKISDSEKNILLSFGFEEIDEWYKSVFLNFLVIPQEGQVGPPMGPFNTYYSWNIFYFNFNDLGDAENGIKTFYYSNLFPTRKKLEEVGIWNNGETFFSSNTITFTLK